MNVHQFAALPNVSAVIVERSNDDVEGLQTAVAFARGACAQYGCRWGVDLSLWWGVMDGCVQDLQPSYHLRNLALSYYAGAGVLFIEGGDLLWDGQAPGQGSPSRLLEAISAFGDFALAHRPGAHLLPRLAIMLPADEGWLAPANWLYNRTDWGFGFLPARSGRRGLDGLFSWAFPGLTFERQPFPAGSFYANNINPPASPFALSALTEPYVASPTQVQYAESPVAFGRFPDRLTSQAAFTGRQALDPSPYRPMADTRWGMHMDALTLDAVLPNSSANFDPYTVLVVAGHAWTQLQGPSLAAAANRLSHLACDAPGRQVFINAGSSVANVSSLSGLTITADLRLSRGWRWHGEPWVSDPTLVAPAQLNPGTGTLQVVATSTGGWPLLTRYTLPGCQGAVWTSLTPFYEGERQDLAGFVSRALDEIMANQSLAAVVNGSGPITWVASFDLPSTKGQSSDAVAANPSSTAANATRWVVALTNNDESPWSGQLQLAASQSWQCTQAEIPSSARATAVPMLLDVSYETTPSPDRFGISVKVSVPPFGAVLVECLRE